MTVLVTCLYFTYLEGVVIFSIHFDHHRTWMLLTLTLESTPAEFQSSVYPGKPALLVQISLTQCYIDLQSLVIFTFYFLYNNPDTQYIIQIAWQIDVHRPTPSRMVDVFVLC